MKSFVVEHGWAIATMVIVTFLITVLAGGSIIATYAAAIACMAIWLWREARKKERA